MSKRRAGLLKIFISECDTSGHLQVELIKFIQKYDLIEKDAIQLIDDVVSLTKEDVKNE